MIDHKDVPRVVAVALCIYILCVLVYLLAYARGAQAGVVTLIVRAKEAFDAETIEVERVPTKTAPGAVPGAVETTPEE